ncbi:MAG: hypothetical protein ACI854_002545 [Arenicella sp.]|jgi:hypothetical protein
MTNKLMVKLLTKLFLCGLLVIGLSACEQQASEDADTSNIISPISQAPQAIAEASFPSNVFWGDTHVHTSNSVDAFGFGNRLDAEASLRFARGEEVTSTRGVLAKLSRPLDFLVISDHSDGLGLTKQLFEAPRELVTEPIMQRWWDTMHASEEGGIAVTSELIDRAAKGDLPPAMTDLVRQNKRTSGLWKAHNETVDRYNQPGIFSAFIGFEYTPMPEGNNLHRVVMFRDGAEKANSVIPLGGLANPDPEQLWSWMHDYEQNSGGQILAMPHNSNVSNGLMFAMTRYDGSPIDKAYAETRAKYEPVVEVTQIKGDSESHPFLSPNDEFANYGVVGWDACNLSCTQDMPPQSYAGSYAREALKRGLEIERKTGVNPYSFGLIGSTDSHTSLATADEDNFFGKHTGNEIDVTDRAIKAQNLGTREGRFGWHYLSSGYAAVWANENTREAIFDAFTRREVYATTGPRMTVRLFGGFDFNDQDLNDLVEAGYNKGVPMGGELKGVGSLTKRDELKNGDAQNVPSFLVAATMDPDSATLDRIQIVKGWIDENSKTHEKVFNVVWSHTEQRAVSDDGKVPAVGNSIDMDSGNWDNSIGQAELRSHWRDPEFNASQNAFYYARVLEIPTPTWPLLDSIKYQFDLTSDVVTVQQERAYTSPIWFKPSVLN